VLAGCSGGISPVDLGVSDLGLHDGFVARDMNVSEDLGDGSAFVPNDLSGPGVQLVEDFCNADLGAYTRCYVTQQPIDGY